MKTRAIWVATVALASAAAWAADNDRVAGPSQTPIIVELFQSQGCSDCPPAQEDLNRLADRPNIVALSYGVTYWDYLGWKDSFASPQFTQRQEDYSTRNHGIGVATPQYWINGRQTLLGASPFHVSQLIDQASLSGGPPLSVAGSNLTVGAGIATPGGADVWLVRYDPRTIQVAIRAGENGGHTIPHRDIVRQLIRIGRWSGMPQTIVLLVPWQRQGQNLDEFPNLHRWFNHIRERPATVSAYARGEPFSSRSVITEESKKVLFGQTLR